MIGIGANSSSWSPITYSTRYMASASNPPGRDGEFNIPMWRYQAVLWTLCGISALFLASRFAVRMSTKGKLMINDYFVVVAFPALCVSVGILQSTIEALYRYQDSTSQPMQMGTMQGAGSAPQLTAAIELLWVAIYCVKFCFLVQFKFHKPPYAYVSKRLTRYYWVSVGICAAALLFTLIQPIVLCPNAANCRYFQSSSTVVWEISVTVIDIVTDSLVILIPILLIHMANFTRSHTIINASFKGLSVFSIAIASTRLALQYQAGYRQINYVALTCWLAIEAAVTIIMASISSWRVVILNRLFEWKVQQRTKASGPNMHGLWNDARGGEESTDGSPDNLQQHSLSDIPMLSPAHFASSRAIT